GKDSYAAPLAKTVFSLPFVVICNSALQISVSKQAKLLKVSRGCYYYRPKPVSASDLKLMRCIDELHMQYPFAGSRMMRDLLNRQGHHIGRRHTRTLMKK
ncbi:IS3 family transposase, partial [Acinetobacter junii]|uniref:IS3 family transposase n=1 Tax=Acinetobacter junii TaxID=40215 RepID=UPI0030F50B88